MRIYFAGSIRGGRADQALYAGIVEELRRQGEVLTEHVAVAALSAMGENGPDDRFIHNRDLEWLRAASVVVAEVSTASLGVGYEIGKATEWGLPVLCLYRPEPGKKLSAMIAGAEGVTTEEYGTLEEAAEHIRRFFAVRSNSDRSIGTGCPGGCARGGSS